jgi:hypothetical protein
MVAKSTLHRVRHRQAMVRLTEEGPRIFGAFRQTRGTLFSLMSYILFQVTSQTARTILMKFAILD